MNRRTILKSLASTAACAGVVTAEPRQANEASRAGGPLIETTDNTRLFWKEWGSGKPVVFLHGAGSCSDQWQYNMIQLSGEGLRCIAYDRRGHGRFERPRAGLRL